MTFEDWFDEIENFSLRSERFFEDLNDYEPGINPEIVIKWLRAAYEVGYDAGGSAQVEWQDYLDRYDD